MEYLRCFKNPLSPRIGSVVHKRKVGIAVRSLIDAASRAVPRATRSEIKIMSAVDVQQLQKKTDEMSKQLRLLDNTIQQTNWTTEL